MYKDMSKDLQNGALTEEELAQLTAIAGVRQRQVSFRPILIKTLTNANSFQSLNPTQREKAKSGHFAIESVSEKDKTQYDILLDGGAFEAIILFSRTGYTAKSGQTPAGYVPEKDAYGSTDILNIVDDGEIVASGTKEELLHAGYTLSREEVVYLLVTEPKLVGQILESYESKGIDTSTFSKEAVYAKFKMTGVAYYNPDNKDCFSSYLDGYKNEGHDQPFLHYTQFSTVSVKNDKYSSTNYYPVFKRGNAIPANLQRTVFEAMTSLRLLINKSDTARDSKLLQLTAETQHSSTPRYVQAVTQAPKEELSEDDIAEAFGGDIKE